MAAINSHAHDLTMQRLLNIKLSPAFLEGESGIQNFIQIIRTFVDRKLWHIQFNVVNRETLLAAQRTRTNTATWWCVWQATAPTSPT